KVSTDASIGRYDWFVSLLELSTSEAFLASSLGVGSSRSPRLPHAQSPSALAEEGRNDRDHLCGRSHGTGAATRSEGETAAPRGSAAPRRGGGRLPLRHPRSPSGHLDERYDDRASRRRGSFRVHLG